MLSSIHPLGERARRQRWSVTVTAYVAGSLLGGAVIGTALGALGSPLPDGPATLGGLVVASAVALGVELAGRRPWSWHRQVDENWLATYRGWVYGAGFGFQLGLGVVTIVTSASLYVALLAALLSGSPVGGLVIGGTFGAVRGVVLLAGHGADTPERLRRLHRRLEGAAGLARSATTASLAVIGAAGVALAVAT